MIFLSNIINQFKYYFKKNPLFTKARLTVFIVYIIGMIAAMYLFNNQTKLDLSSITNNDLSRVSFFMRVFFIQVGPVMFLWILGFIPCGALLSLIIVFLKGYINGTILKIAFKNNLLFRSVKLFKYILCDYLIIVPLIIVLSAFLFKVRNYKKNVFESFLYSYIKVLLLAILIVSIYSVIVTLIWR